MWAWWWPPLLAMVPAIVAGLPSTSPSLVFEQDEALSWWQLRALESGEQLARTQVDDRALRPGTPQPTPLEPQSTRRTVVGTANLAAEQGHVAENHTVHTTDGYQLTMFRLANPGKSVVVLAHALLGSSADFFVLGKGRALAPLLHDAGFDVWLFNARGSTPSRKHDRLSPLQPRFWDFSWHEIGVFDLPASIDYVIKHTNQTQLHFVGYCQGATAFFVMASERPEYMEKVKTFVGLSPVAFVRDIRSFPIRLFSVTSNKLAFMLKLMGVNEFMPSGKLTAFLGDMLCSEGEPFQQLCSNILFLIFGTDSEQLNTTILPDFFANSPAGASTKQIVHYGQLVNHKRQVFRQFDYGRTINLKRYHSAKPPEYDLSRVTVPAHLFYADNDLICVQSNIEELGRKLPNIPEGGLHRVPNARFNHLDFILAKDAKELLYDDVIAVLQKHDTAPLSSTASPSAAPSTNGSGSSSSNGPSSSSSGTARTTASV